MDEDRKKKESEEVTETEVKKESESETAPEENDAEQQECCEECCAEDESDESKEEKDNSEILELRAKNLILESQIAAMKKAANEKMIEFVDKKSKEAEKLINEKQKELSDKYKREYDEKLKFFYSKPLSSLVEIISQFEVVLNGITDPSVAGYLVGFKMFLSQFDSLLSDFCISQIVPQEGDEFDSDIMEASATKKVEESELDNKITGVFRKGYKLHDRVIKLASVEVGKVEEN